MKKASRPKQLAAFFDSYKAAIATVTALIISLCSFAQDDIYYLKPAAPGYEYARIRVSISTRLPRDTVHLIPEDSGCIAIKNSWMYMWNGYRWDTLRTSVVHDITLKGQGTLRDQLKVDTSTIATISYVNSKSSSYVLPVASAITLGGIKVGSGLAIDGTGMLTSTGTVGNAKSISNGIAQDGNGLIISHDSIVFFGDSYTQGSGATTAAQRWTSLLCTYLNAIEDNHGVAGTTVEKRVPINYMAGPNLIDALPNVPVKTFKKKLLVIAYGLNDMGQTGGAYSPQNYKIDYDSALNYIINTKKWPAKNILIVGPYWIGQAGYNRYAGITGNAAPTVARHLEFRDSTRAVAVKYGTMFIDEFDNQLRNDTTLILGTPDFIHMPDSGQLYVAKNIFQYLSGGTGNASNSTSFTGPNTLISNVNNSSEGQNGFIAYNSAGNYAAMAINPPGAAMPGNCAYFGGSKGVALFSNALLGTGGSDTIKIMQGGSQATNGIFGTSTGWGIKKYPSADFDVNGKLQISLSGGTNQDTWISPANTFANFASLNFYPASGSNVGQSLNVIPRSTVLTGNLKAQLTVFNTDFVADASNYEGLFLRAASTEYAIAAVKGGTGSARPVYIDATGGFSAATSNIYFGTSGNVGIGTAYPANKLEVNSGVADVSGLRLTRLKNTSPVTANSQAIGVNANGDIVTIAGSGYTLPSATSSTLGGIKVGDGLTIDSAGVLTANIIPFASGSNIYYDFANLVYNQRNDVTNVQITGGTGNIVLDRNLKKVISIDRVGTTIGTGYFVKLPDNPLSGDEIIIAGGGPNTNTNGLAITNGFLITNGTIIGQTIPTTISVGTVIKLVNVNGSIWVSY